MSTTSPETTTAAPSMIDPVRLLDASRHSADVMTAATELVSKTMSEIVAKQVDLIRVEGSEIARTAAALAQAGEPAEKMQNYAAALRSGAEGALTDLREIQDLMRDCVWSLYGLYVDAISVAAGNGHLAKH